MSQPQHQHRPPLQDTFRLDHYEARTVAKQPVGIRLSYAFFFQAVIVTAPIRPASYMWLSCVVYWCCNCLAGGIAFALSCKFSHLLFTARKRSLRKLCFYRCLSVHRGGACVVAGGRAWLRGACVVAGVVCGCRGHAWLWGHVWL